MLAELPWKLIVRITRKLQTSSCFLHARARCLMDEPNPVANDFSV